MATNSTSMICVLGMHRSGTSALAGLCHKLGIAMGKDFLETTEDNAHGFFEDSQIVDLHDAILGKLGLKWDSLHSLPHQWQQSEILGTYKSDLKNLLESKLDQPVWGIKDPRLSRLLPLWKELIPELPITPHYLITVRHPFEVAASLAQRDQMSPYYALLLWLLYNLECEYHTRNTQRHIISYPQFLSDWKTLLSTLVDNWQLPISQLTAEKEQELNAFLSDNLYHHKKPDIGDIDTSLTNMVDTVYSLLTQPELSTNDLKTLDTIRQECILWVRAIQDILHDREQKNQQLSKELTLMQHALRSCQNECELIQLTAEQYEQTINNVRASFSWRLTKPFRIVYRKITSWL